MAIVATGMHELFGLLLCIVLAVGTAIAFRVGHHSRWLWLGVLAVAIIGLVFVLAAPGNYIRASEYHAGQNLRLTLREGSEHLLRCVLAWAMDPKLLFASLLFVFHPAIRRIRPPWLDWVRARWTAVLP